MNHQEPKPPLGEPEMPKGMSRCARREWNNIKKSLMEMKVLSTVDGKALGEYCKLIGLAETYYKDALKEPMVYSPVLDGDGHVIVRADGTIYEKAKPNPSLAAYLACSKAAKMFLIEFGLTPASRTRLKVDKASAEQPEDAFLNHGRGAEGSEEHQIGLEDIPTDVLQ